MVDINNSGFVDGYEIGKVLSTIYGKKITKNAIEQMMKVIDPQDKGGINLEDFVEIIKFD